MQSAFKFLLAGTALVVVVGLGAMFYSLYQASVEGDASGSPPLAAAQGSQQKPAQDPASNQCPLATPGSGYVSGGHIYRLSNEVFRPGGSLQKEIHDRYLSDAELADWDDLKAILVTKDDVRKFIQDTGIRLQSKNYDCDNILISRAGGETVKGLHYHLARHDGAIPADWSVLDSIGDNDIHLGRWNHSGQALLRLSRPD